MSEFRSLAREHRTRMLAMASAGSVTAPAATGVREAAPPPVPTGPAAIEQALQLAQLGVDRRRLQEIQSIEKKIELKRQLLPAYQSWVEGVVAAADQTGQGVDDEVLAYVMIWSIDVGDFAAALPLAEYVLRWNCPLPVRFERTAGCLIAEEIAEAALKAQNANKPFDIATLLAVEDLVEGEDMPDEVHAKLKKAIGLELARAAEAIDPNADGPAGQRRGALELAAGRLRRALELDQRVGVKKRLDGLDREIAKLAPPPPAGDAS